MVNRIRIKPVQPTSGKHLTAHGSIDYEKKPILFSLERVVDCKYCLSKLDKNDKAAFASSIFKRKNLSWSDLKSIDRHGLGFEKIPKERIKGSSLPRFITEDVDILISFRYSGKKAMVGYRKNDIFFVLWFDHDFSLYPH